MDLSYKINLKDSKSIILDDSGKSIACFTVNDIVAIDNSVIDQLIGLSEELGKKDIRICLHQNNESKLHNMINLIYKKKLNVPHKHLDKSESYHIIRGQMIISIYDNEANIKDKYFLDENDTFLFRVGKDNFHTTVPVSDYVIVHETRSGPFNKNGDSIFFNKK